MAEHEDSCAESLEEEKREKIFILCATEEHVGIFKGPYGSYPHFLVRFNVSEQRMIDEALSLEIVFACPEENSVVMKVIQMQNKDGLTIADARKKGEILVIGDDEVRVALRRFRSNGWPEFRISAPVSVRVVSPQRMLEV